MREFKIPGKIQAKQRPRFSKSGVVYTPKETRVYEDFVRVCYSDYANQYQWEPYDGQLRAEIEVFIQVPKSDSKLNKQAKIIGKAEFFIPLTFISPFNFSLPQINIFSILASNKNHYYNFIQDLAN